MENHAQRFSDAELIGFFQKGISLQNLVVIAGGMERVEQAFRWVLVFDEYEAGAADPPAALSEASPEVAAAAAVAPREPIVQFAVFNILSRGPRSLAQLVEATAATERRIQGITASLAKRDYAMLDGNNRWVLTHMGMRFLIRLRELHKTYVKGKMDQQFRRDYRRDYPNGAGTQQP